jgi:hypothetical protein
VRTRALRRLGEPGRVPLGSQFGGYNVDPRIRALKPETILDPNEGAASTPS